MLNHFMSATLCAVLFTACLDPGGSGTVLAGPDTTAAVPDALADASPDAGVDVAVANPDVVTKADTSPPLPDVVVGPPDVGVPDVVSPPDIVTVTDVGAPPDAVTVPDVTDPPDVGLPDAVPPAGECQNANDQSICSSCGGAAGPACGDACPDSQAWAQDEATNCGLGCLGDADPESCSTTCLVQTTGLTTGCAGCYAALILCTIDSCLSQCVADPGGDPCLECTEANCLGDFDNCTGL